MKRLLCLFVLLPACSEIAVPGQSMPVVTEEVVVFEVPIAGGAATAKLEFAALKDVYPADQYEALSESGYDFHPEAHVRYTGPLLGGRSAGDFVPYLDVTMTLENVDTGARWEGLLIPGFGLLDGWHYMADIDLDGDLGLSGAGYEARLEIRLGEGVIQHEDVLDAGSGTFLGSEPLSAGGFFTLEDLEEPAAHEETEGAEEPSEPAPGMGYGY